ncbi:hypothetical protein GSI_11369 [Ganoderma sinense ZZ0214-1]|uniref:Uncharacterized protein n=1 Tax=Ganoderma sinense ZZ0214-1 TaxID=1077348 RepID=A0A2G8RVT0_9APHY|nr:hypothetical protein GSI_11369 [Ganoderma sinense ZZ0214-1]
MRTRIQTCGHPQLDSQPTKQTLAPPWGASSSSTRPNQPYTRSCPTTAAAPTPGTSSNRATATRGAATAGSSPRSRTSTTRSAPACMCLPTRPSRSTASGTSGSSRRPARRSVMYL